MTDLGKIWRPVIKSGAYPGSYFRTAHAARSSERVKAVNKKFIETSKACKVKNLHTSNKSFQNCIRDGMLNFKAPGTDAPSYTQAKKYMGKI